MEGRIGKALWPLVAKRTWEALRPAWQRYLTGREAQYSCPEDFAQKLRPRLEGDSAPAQGRYIETAQEIRAREIRKALAAA